LAAQECTTNQRPGQQVDPTLDMTKTQKLSSLEAGELGKISFVFAD